MRKVEVTQEILDTKPDPESPCDCAIHRAIVSQLGLKAKKVHIGYHDIEINGRHFRCSELLTDWQKDFAWNYVPAHWDDDLEEEIPDNWDNCRADPITIVLDNGMAFLIEEMDEYGGDVLEREGLV